jgi:poly-gamma-glutamate capsule biosynthesis protein CapA/YwtB (metallophosphatase superfamily)
MQRELNIAITGDTILNRRISIITEEKFLSIVNVLKNADVAYTNLETVIHDYEGPEVYPAAEAGYTWMRSPRFITEELKWLGFNMVSHASNHCMDYSYGGLFSTLNALDDAGIVHAGTGRNLAEARSAVYLETKGGRVALVSMCSSFTGWARAGEMSRDIKGRPGLNPLRYYYAVDKNTMETLKRLAVRLGWWVLNEDGAWLFHPAGTHHAIYKFVESDRPGIQTVPEDDDVKGNLRSIRDAKRQADLVLVSVHNHEWDAEKGLEAPSRFVIDFAKACIDAGADVFIAEGSHTPLRGLEIYKSKPIFYDPGDFIVMNNTVTKLPYDFYSRVKAGLKASVLESTTADALDARLSLPQPLNPPGGYNSAPILGGVVPVCSFASNQLTQLKLYPFTLMQEPRSQSGLPILAEVDLARSILEHLKQLSFGFGTDLEIKDAIGFVKLSS